MAYFEFGYVNTGYDENSATAPTEEEYNAILNIVNSSFCSVYSAIVNMNNNIESEVVALERILNIRYTVTSERIQKLSNFNNDINANLHEGIVGICLSVDLPKFPHSNTNFHHSFGDAIDSQVVVLRRNEND